MAKKILKSDLSVSGIKNLQKQLQDYQKSLASKCEEFIRRLAEIGIETAKHNTGNFGHYITFSVKTEPNKDGCKGLMIATETGKIISQWQTKDGIKSADVSPLLMVEFGSGWRAENPMNVPGVGQGTFPDQSHAFDKDGWYWVDLNGELHHSYGITPKMPMYNAYLAMEMKIIETAKDVFGK